MKWTTTDSSIHQELTPESQQDLEATIAKTKEDKQPRNGTFTYDLNLRLSLYKNNFFTGLVPSTHLSFAISIVSSSLSFSSACSRSRSSACVF